MGLGAPYMVLWRVRAFSAIIQDVGALDGYLVEG